MLRPRRACGWSGRMLHLEEAVESRNLFIAVVCGRNRGKKRKDVKRKDPPARDVLPIDSMEESSARKTERKEGRGDRGGLEEAQGRDVECSFMGKNVRGSSRVSAAALAGAFGGGAALQQCSGGRGYRGRKNLRAGGKPGRGRGITSRPATESLETTSPARRYAIATLKKILHRRPLRPSIQNGESSDLVNPIDPATQAVVHYANAKSPGRWWKDPVSRTPSPSSTTTTTTPTAATIFAYRSNRTNELTYETATPSTSGHRPVAGTPNPRTGRPTRSSPARPSSAWWQRLGPSALRGRRGRGSLSRETGTRARGTFWFYPGAGASNPSLVIRGCCCTNVLGVIGGRKI